VKCSKHYRKGPKAGLFRGYTTTVPVWNALFARGSRFPDSESVPVSHPWLSGSKSSGLGKLPGIPDKEHSRLSE